MDINVPFAVLMESSWPSSVHFSLSSWPINMYMHTNNDKHILVIFTGHTCTRNILQ